MCADSSPENYVDIAIVGGGIAGTSLAMVMQHAGYSTAIIEREPVYRDRVRGEACHPWGVRELRQLGLESIVEAAGAVSLPTWTRYENRSVDISFDWADVFPGALPEIGFSHPRLQEALLNGAGAAGSMIFRPACASVRRDQQNWHLHIQDADHECDLRARFLVAADGKSSATRRSWGAKAMADATHHQFGGMLVEGIELSATSAHQGMHDAGFSMLFPQGHDCWRAYFVGSENVVSQFRGQQRADSMLAACSACFPPGAFDVAKVRGPMGIFSNAHIVVDRIAGEMSVAIGDAAGAPDPSQGHGISLAWRDVRLLRDLLLNEHWTDVPQLFETERRTYESILRTHAAWVAPLTTERSDAAIALRAQVDLAREADPSALGYAAIFANGPDSQPTDDDARAKFFGEHLTPQPVRIPTPLDKLL